MNSLIPHIRYHSAYGGHPILRRDAGAAYNAVLEFLDTCTDFAGRWTQGRVSVSPTGGVFLPDDWDAQPAKRLLTRRFGVGRVGITSNNMCTLESESQHDWEIPARLHDWALEFALAQPKARRGYPDPVNYTCAADFRLCIPGPSTQRRAKSDTSRTSGIKPRAAPLPGQAAKASRGWTIRSSILFHVSAGNSSAFFDLVFPFPEPGDEFVRYIAAIRPYLPIRLAKGNFKHYVPAKSGAEYRTRRIDRSLLDAV